MRKICKKKSLLVIFFFLMNIYSFANDLDDAEKAFLNKNYVLAIEKYQKSSLEGNDVAAYKLGQIFDQGLGVKKDYEVAKKWFKLSAEKGNAAAQNALGIYYLNGLGLLRDYSQAMRWFKLAAEQGESSSIFHIGLMFENGRGVLKNYPEAYKYYKLAAEKNNSKAMNHIGELLESGKIFDRDYKKAFDIYRFNADTNGDSQAQAKLGDLYSKGRGVEQDSNKAFTWYLIASRNGNSHAKKQVNELFNSIEPKDISTYTKLADNCKLKLFNDCSVDIDNLRGSGVLISSVAATDKKKSDQAIDISNQSLEIQRLVKEKEDQIAKLKEQERVTLENQKLVNDKQEQLARAKNEERLALLEKEKNLELDNERKKAKIEIDKLKAEKEVLTLQLALSFQKQDAPDPPVKQVFANRKALVIGNNRYTKISTLQNAVQDAQSIADSLEAVGYKVTLLKNLNQSDMKAEIRKFKTNVDGGDEVLFFYAGHGVQIESTNYLLPVNISGESVDEIKDDSIPLQKFLDDMQEKKAKFTLAMIDACRDNPFKTAGRSIGTRGLSPTTPASGQMIIFSAGTNEKALDKVGEKDTSKNGLFTRVFLEEMQQGGVPVDRILKKVKNRVVEIAKSVNHDQMPAIYDQTVGDFYFKK